MPLTLSIAGLSVEFDKFLESDYPRVTVQPLSVVEFSILGTPAIQGSYFEPKFLWNFTAVCDQQQRDLLEAIAYEFHTRRRTLADGDILIYDTTATLIERSRSRAIVPGTAEVKLNGETHTVYYGQFKAGLTDGPKFSKLGRYDSVSVSLTETIKVPVA